jgi:MEMO1 family protein
MSNRLPRIEFQSRESYFENGSKRMNHSMTQIRPPAVAGMFYPADADRLGAQVLGMLGETRLQALPPGQPKALIAPHAGYVYSGPVAAHAYALLTPWRERIHRVVLLGPTHRVPVRGLAWPDAGAFDTPLGAIPVDMEALAAIRALPQVTISSGAHAWEHSLEVHLPFLQKVLPDFRLAPLAVGDAQPEEVAEVLDRLWGGEETLIVISSDLSHYLSYDEARHTDARTVQSILDLDQPLDHHQACGATPINGLIVLARRRHLRPRLLDLRNSGDTAGDRSQVVGYAALAFYEAGRHE